MITKKFCVCLAAAFISLNSTASSFRVNDPYYCAVAVDAKTGEVLVSDGGDKIGYPASVTKMMTFLLYIEMLERGEILLTDEVHVNREAAEVGERQVWLEAGEKFSVEDMLYALMVHSANDVARALALHVSPTRDEFVKKMNARAKELGMTSTIYTTESGLPPGGGVSPDTASANDLTILAREIAKRPMALAITGTKFRKFRNGSLDLRSSNHLLGTCEGVDGLKTGFHSRGGFSIAVTAERNNERIVAVVLGSPQSRIRDAAAKKLIEKAFDKIEEKRGDAPPVKVEAKPLAPEQTFESALGADNMLL